MRSNPNYVVAIKATDTDANQTDYKQTSPALNFVVQSDKIVPQITAFSAVPNTFTADGGAVTVSVRAKDNMGVQATTLYLTKPDGSRSGMRLTMSSGTSLDGEWKASWQIPVNSTTVQQAYGLQITASDALNNIATSQPINIVVYPKASAPQKPVMPVWNGPPKIQK